MNDVEAMPIKQWLRKSEANIWLSFAKGGSLGQFVGGICVMIYSITQQDFGMFLLGVLSFTFGMMVLFLMYIAEYTDELNEVHIQYCRSSVKPKHGDPTVVCKLPANHNQDNHSGTTYAGNTYTWAVTKMKN